MTRNKLGKQHIKMNGQRGFKSLSLWGRSCWADGRADTLVRQTRVGQTRFDAFWSRFWSLDFGSWILMDFGVWDFGSLILDSVLGFGVLIFDSVSCFFVVVVVLVVLWKHISMTLWMCHWEKTCPWTQKKTVHIVWWAFPGNGCWWKGLRWKSQGAKEPKV